MYNAMDALSRKIFAGKFRFPGTLLIPRRDGGFHLVPEDFSERFLYARQRASKSKTGDPACSVAASHWARKTATAEDYKTLAACRAKARGMKQASSLRDAGQEAKAQHIENRLKTGEPLTAKARVQKAKELVKGRAESFKESTIAAEKSNQVAEERARRMAEVEERIRRGHEEAEKREKEEAKRREQEESEKKTVEVKAKKESAPKKPRETAKEKQARIDEEINKRIAEKFIKEREFKLKEAERAFQETPKDLRAKLALAKAMSQRLEVEEHRLSMKISAGTIKAGPNELDPETKGFVEERRRLKQKIDDLFGEALIGLSTPVPGTHAVHGMTTPEEFHRIEHGGVSFNYNQGSRVARNAMARFLSTFIDSPPIPRGISRHTKQVYLTEQRNNMDSYWQNHAEYKKVLEKGEEFVSNGTGGGGNVVIYNGYIPKKTLFHEMGHNLATGIWDSITPYGEYAKAIASGEPPVSTYAGVNSAEDFAEAVKDYLLDPDKLMTTHPKRAKAIQNLIMEHSNA